MRPEADPSTLGNSPHPPKWERFRSAGENDFERHVKAYLWAFRACLRSSELKEWRFITWPVGWKVSAIFQFRTPVHSQKELIIQVFA
jgi:hypothetical protein